MVKKKEIEFYEVRITFLMSSREGPVDLLKMELENRMKDYFKRAIEDLKVEVS